MNVTVVQGQRPKRTCGECKACCTTCAVTELDKPINTPCVHLAQIGCGIYESRPASCRQYDCAWLLGYLAEEDRPDRSGIVFSFEQVPHLKGQLLHAMLTDDSVPLERLERLYNAIRRFVPEKVTLQVIPASLRVRAHKNVYGRPIKPGVYLAVGESPEE